MKKLSFTAFLLASLLAVFSAPPARAQVQVSISIGGFYDELAPYGRWVDCSWGGCWVPGGISRDWQPYSNGEWIYTEYGWTWISYDPWGDDPYHYGTWASTDRYGWVWIPGTIWAPAWVTWTYSDDYIGWAPLPPSIVVGWSGYSGGPLRLTPTSYVVVPIGRFSGGNVSSHRIPRDRSTTIFHRTRPVTRFEVSRGIIRNTAIPFERVQQRSRTRIERRNIRDARTAPRPVPEWSRGERRQLAIVAPAREVKEATLNRRPETGRKQPAPAAPAQKAPQVAPPAPAAPVKKAPQVVPQRVSAPKAAPAQKAPAAPAVQARPSGQIPKQPASARPDKGTRGGVEKKAAPGKPAKPGNPGKP